MLCEYVKGLECPGWIYWALTLFYGIFPVFSTYISVVMKDTFYMAAVTCFMAKLAKAVDQLKQNAEIPLNKHALISMCIAALLMCLSCKEAKICVTLTLLYFIFVIIKL